jgi:hypothetical protein
MATTPETSGTSPEILQHYLTAGIPIRNTRFNLERKLEINCLHPEGLLFESMWKWEYADCLPVLKPFAALTTPLPDGTVPAVEIIKMWGLYSNPESEARTQEMVLAILQGKEIGYYSMSAEITFDDVANAIDYLRSKHFALPIAGRPLIEGKDYIAKDPAPASTTIQEPTQIS